MAEPCGFLAKLEAIVKDRLSSGDEGSYTYRLYMGGVGLMSRKVGEEAVELVVATLSGDRGGIVHEAADLIYHLIVLLNSMGISMGEVCNELLRRHLERGGGDG